MARRSSRPRRGRGSGSAAPILVSCLAIAFILAIGGGFAYITYQSMNKVALDDQMCPVTGPEGVTIFLVDTTDPVHPTTLMDARNRLRDEVKNLNVGHRIEIYGLTEKPGELEEMFGGCKPSDGSDADFLTENKRLIMRDWEESFAKPIAEVEGKIGQSAGGSKSPIMAAIQNIKLRVLDKFKDQPIRKKMIVLSDMIEHTEHYSQYRSGSDFAAFKASSASREYRTDLSGINVEFWFIDRGIAQFSGVEHQTFWANWVRTNHGNFERSINLEGLNPQGSSGAN